MKTTHVPLDASAVDEPSDDKVVVMLEALPYHEQQFYSEESPTMCLSAGDIARLGQNVSAVPVQWPAGCSSCARHPACTAADAVTSHHTVGHPAISNCQLGQIRPQLRMFWRVPAWSLSP